MQSLDRVGMNMESLLQAAYLNNAGEKMCLASGTTVIWRNSNAGLRDEFFRGVVENNDEENIIKIFLPDIGSVKFVKSSSVAMCPDIMCTYPARAVMLRPSNMVDMEMMLKDHVVLVTVQQSDMTAYIRIVDSLQ